MRVMSQGATATLATQNRSMRNSNHACARSCLRCRRRVHKTQPGACTLTSCITITTAARSHAREQRSCGFGSSTKPAFAPSRQKAGAGVAGHTGTPPVGRERRERAKEGGRCARGQDGRSEASRGQVAGRRSLVWRVKSNVKVPGLCTP